MEEKMKKKVALVLVLLLAVVTFIAGCKKDTGKDTITLNFWRLTSNETRDKIWDEAIKRFETENPGVKIIPNIYENEPYKTKLKTVTGDDFPDVFYSWSGGWLKSFIDVGLVEDITEYTRGVEDIIGPARKNFAAFNGKVYGLPYSGGTTILYYNKEIFARYNLSPPTTLPELDRVAETLLANNVTPFALANLTKWPGAAHFVLLSMRIGGPDIFQQVVDGKAKFTDDAFIQAGDILSSQVAKGYFPVGANGANIDTGQERMMFYSGDYGMMFQLNGYLNNIKLENPDFYTKIGVTTYPEVPGGKGKRTDHLSGGGTLSVSSNSKHKEMAAKFVRFISTDQKYQADNLETLQLPTRLGLSSKEPLVQEVLNLMQAATFVQNYVDQTLSPAMAELHKDTTQAIYSKTMTSRQVADSMQRGFDSGL
jgi:raffinose/stachyose/melibiose transport system substrate-binding protein